MTQDVLPTRVLVALDGTPGSALALEWAQDFAHAAKASVLVASVEPNHRPPVMWIDRDLGHGHGVLLTRAKREEVTDAAARALLTDGIQAEAVVDRGRPANVLVNLARRNRAGLIILGTHEHNAAQRLLVGSVGEEVLQLAGCDALVARGPVHPRTILIAADATPSSRRADALATAYAAATHGACLRLHVVEDDRDHEHALHAQPVSTKLATAGPGLAKVRHLVDSGTAAQQLIERANEEGCGLIATGMRNRTRVERLLFGSVSRDVLRASRASVLIAKEGSPWTTR